MQFRFWHNGNETEVTLRNVLFVPQLLGNLLSVSQMAAMVHRSNLTGKVHHHAEGADSDPSNARRQAV